MATQPTDKDAPSTVEVIVVPLDGSEFSEHAIPIATALAIRVGARLVLMSSLEAGAEESAPRLEKIAANIHGIDTRIEVIREMAAEEAIELVARKAGNSAVCMTTHGRGALRWAMLGSVAEHVVRLARRPVVLVGRRCDPARAVGDGRMLVCHSGAEASEEVVGHAAAWARALNLEMHGAVVIHPLDVEGAEYPRELLGPIGDRLGRRGVTLPLAVLRSSYPAGALVDYADQLDASMIAMTSHARTGLGRVALGSVTTGVVGLAECPVLVTRASR